MSRCFPYPPPGYVRNPVAVAEAESTAKLQKEREKAEKKKEKRSETYKHSKHSHKKRKHDNTGQDPKKDSKELVEQLEKSGLSEEHGAPCFVQTVRDSPESSQDSSKRRKVVLPSPSQTKNGNILRIKIKREQDLSGLLEKPRVVEQPSVQHMGSASSLLSKQSSIHHHNKVNVKSTAAAQQRINGDSQPMPKQMSTQLPAKVMRRYDPQTVAEDVSRIGPQLPLKRPVGVADLLPAKMVGSVPQPARVMGSADPPPARVMGRVDPPPARVMGRVDPPPARLMGRVDPLPANTTHTAQAHPAKVFQRVDVQLPYNAQKECATASVKVMQKEINTSAIHKLEVPQPPLVHNAKVVQFQEPGSSVLKEEPCSSGRKADSAPVQEGKQSRSDRKKSRKAEKKEEKFRDLFVTWNPLSFEMEGSNLGGQDWLLGSTRNSDASMTNCRASDGSVPYQRMEQQPSLLPRATFLPDLRIYQLPYVVPF